MKNILKNSAGNEATEAGGIIRPNTSTKEIDVRRIKRERHRSRRRPGHQGGCTTKERYKRRRGHTRKAKATPDDRASPSLGSSTVASWTLKFECLSRGPEQSITGRPSGEKTSWVHPRNDALRGESKRFPCFEKKKEEKKKP